MTDPQTFLLMASGFVVVNAGTHIGVKIIIDRLLNNGHKGNGFCKEHHTLKETLDSILENQKEERQEEMMERIFTKALKKNGK